MTQIEVLIPYFNSEMDNKKELIEESFNLVSNYIKMNSLYGNFKLKAKMIKIDLDDSDISEFNIISNLKQFKPDLVLLGLFKNLNGIRENNRGMKLKNSKIVDNYFQFVNYDKLSILESDENIIPSIYVSEFANLLFYNLHINGIETHKTDSCFRNLSTVIDKIESIEHIELLKFAKFKVKNLIFCETCINKLVSSLYDIFSQNKSILFDEVTLNSSELSGQSGETLQKQYQPIKKASKPPSRRHIVSSSAQLKQEFRNRFSSEQDEQIEKVLNDLNLSYEPSDEDYLEVRNRFLQGKISEDVFKQILKRKSI